jgi:hypothetical protein
MLLDSCSAAGQARVGEPWLPLCAVSAVGPTSRGHGPYTCLEASFAADVPSVLAGKLRALQTMAIALVCVQSILAR